MEINLKSLNRCRLKSKTCRMTKRLFVRTCCNHCFVANVIIYYYYNRLRSTFPVLLAYSHLLGSFPPSFVDPTLRAKNCDNMAHHNSPASPLIRVGQC